MRCALAFLVLVAAAAVSFTACSSENVPRPDTPPRSDSVLPLADRAAGLDASGPVEKAGPTVDGNGGPTVDGGSGLAAQLELCAPASDPHAPSTAFTAVAGPNNEWVRYKCKAGCAGDWNSCAHSAYRGVNLWTYSRSAGSSQTKLAVEFVVDEMAGTLYITPDGTDTVFFHGGAGATSPGGWEVSAWLEQHSNARTVLVAWEAGSPQALTSTSGGWWTRKDGNPTTVQALVHRPAVVIAWTHANLAAGYRFGTAGSSLGTMATLGPVLWGPLDPVVDYQLVMGGSVFWDINATCCRAAAGTQGHCDSDARPCQSDASCTGGQDHCRFPTDWTTPQFAQLINYVFKVNGDPSKACLTASPGGPGTPNPDFDSSSFSKTTVHWSVGHTIHFIADEDGVGSSPPAPSHTADQNVMEGSAMFAFERLEQNSPAHPPLWTDKNGYYHGDSFGGDPTLVPETGGFIKAEMGL